MRHVSRCLYLFNVPLFAAGVHGAVRTISCVHSPQSNYPRMDRLQILVESNVPLFIDGTVATPSTMVVAVCLDEDGLELVRLVAPERQLEALLVIDADGWTVQFVKKVHHLASVPDALGGFTRLYQDEASAWSIAVEADDSGLFGICAYWRDNLGLLIKDVRASGAANVEALSHSVDQLMTEPGQQ